ncbi:FadR/GntR family transcriptional regulator [Leekyejoonella antrihumi]|uniref:FadR/GntR family transcriptional regulator n=1 Tax=Leekyejoonella antrihumi TaxID=1660198 RepID=UPI001C96F008|nr:FadR/GntR family transcriptional regulator [Leekyejoonella antrihumi]
MRLATASGEVADRLVTAIALGEYLPGHRLPSERKLAAAMGVSRPAVREALARLGGSGIVEIRRGRSGGAFVRTSWGAASADAIRHALVPRWNEFEQLLDLRSLIDDIVGRVAAERSTPTQQKEMGAALKKYRNAANPAEEQIADAAFHSAILASTGNPQLFQLSRSLLAGTSLAIPFEPWPPEQGVDRAGFLRALADHEAIYDAICNHDAEQAGQLSRRHFEITAETFRDVLARAQSDPQEDQPQRDVSASDRPE